MRRKVPVFWRVMAATGFCFALLVGALHWPLRWWVLVLRASAAGMLFGATVGLIVLLERYDLPKTLIRFLGVPAAGIGLYIGLQQLPNGVWERLPIPPKPLVMVQIVDAYRTLSLGVTGQSADGATWMLEVDGPSGARWVTVEDAQVTKSGASGCSERFVMAAAPRPPGHVVAADEEIVCGPDYAGYYRVALLADGSIWFWGDFDSAQTELTSHLLVALVAVTCGILAPYVGHWLAPGGSRSASRSL